MMITTIIITTIITATTGIKGIGLPPDKGVEPAVPDFFAHWHIFSSLFGVKNGRVKGN